MNLLHWFKRKGRRGSLAKTEAVIRRLGHPVRIVSDGRWEVRELPLLGYWITLQAWEFQDRAEFVAFTDIVIGRDWFQRGMAMWLLEENDKLRVGSLRLIETRQGMQLALGRVCELPLYTEAALGRVASELLMEAARIIQKLLAMEFISRRGNDDDVAQKISS